jgi:hypothetical protein
VGGWEWVDTDMSGYLWHVVHLAVCRAITSCSFIQEGRPQAVPQLINVDL